MERVSSQAQQAWEIPKRVNFTTEWLKDFFFPQKSWTAEEWTTNLVNKVTVVSAYTAKIDNHYQNLYRNRFGNNSNIERSISNQKSKSNIS